MEHSYTQRNAASLDRLRALIRRLTDADLARDLGDGWTVAVALAHLAFWDRYQAARWSEAAKAALPLPEEVGEATDNVVNVASLESWRSTPPRVAAEQALAAAEHIDQLVAAVDAALAAQLLAAGRTTLLDLLDRTGHWNEHIEQIEAALAG